jgi:hypothetical protein
VEIDDEVIANTVFAEVGVLSLSGEGIQLTMLTARLRLQSIFFSMRGGTTALVVLALWSNAGL